MHHLGPLVPTAAGAPSARSLALALAMVAVCATLVGLAATLPGRTAEGLLLGSGSTIAAMVATAHPAVPLASTAAYALTAVAVIMARWSPRARRTREQRGEDARGHWQPVRRSGSSTPTASLGGYWLGIPVALLGLLNGASLAPTLATIAVFALLATDRRTDHGIGYVAGVLVALAALVASSYGQAAGDGAVLAYPAGAAVLAALGVAGRVGLDPTFAAWQRISVGAVGAAAAATAGIGGHLPAGLTPSGDRDVFGYLAALDRPAGLAPWLGLVAMLAGSGIVMWRVTAAELPLWVPIHGLAMLTGVLALGPGAAVGLAGSGGPGPAWVLTADAELSAVRLRYLRAGEAAVSS